MNSIVLSLTLLATLAQVAHSQAADPSEYCLNDYCNAPAGSCAPHCCSLPTQQEIGNCLAGGSQGGGSPPLSNSQCSSFMGFIDACETLTPSFTALQPSAQATCLCYDDQGNFVPDSFDQAALGCYQWAEASDTAYAAELSSAGSLGFCTNNAAAAPSSALLTSAVMSGTFASNVEVSSIAAITGFSLTSSETAATKTGVEGAGSGTESPLTSTTPTSTTAANNASPSTASNHSSEACLWISPTYFLGVAILVSTLILTLL
ncbi:hypothetical protein JMJ35_010574 [Cladonia borealis]|uniref:Uncharacterized protein n=1 Tax=Cladonia borealis TaxID=184061 RepID=A0AA39U3Q1_9LECA|nr:hypothetical protein JMJ35_010574 [Cladonia borealis]